MIAPERIGWQGAWARRGATFATSRHRREPRSSLPRTRHRPAACSALRAAPFLVLLSALFVQGCTLFRVATLPRLARCDAAIPSSAALGSADHVWRDRARYRGDDVDESFLLVAEKRGPSLVLVGLNAFGARVLSVTQQGERIEADARLGPALAVPPENVLRDWHEARAASREPGETFEIVRPECGYRASFILERSEPLSASPSP